MPQHDTPREPLAELEALRAEVEALRAATANARMCPDCDGRGWYVVGGGGPEPEQEQCERCHGTGAYIPDVPAAELEALRCGVLSIVARCVYCRDGLLRYAHYISDEHCYHCGDLRDLLLNIGVLSEYGQHVEPEEDGDAMS